MERRLSKTKIKNRLKRKTNPEIKKIIESGLKNPRWSEIAKLLSSSTRKKSSVNLFEIDAQTFAGDTIIVPGKVLSKGEITKKVRICALGFSSEAREKLKETKSEAVLILDEIKKNPKMEGVKVIR